MLQQPIIMQSRRKFTANEVQDPDGAISIAGIVHYTIFVKNYGSAPSATVTFYFRTAALVYWKEELGRFVRVQDTTGQDVKVQFTTGDAGPLSKALTIQPGFTAGCILLWEYAGAATLDADIILVPNQVIVTSAPPIAGPGGMHGCGGCGGAGGSFRKLYSGPTE